jgi:hypothetical protein
MKNTHYRTKHAASLAITVLVAFMLVACGSSGGETDLAAADTSKSKVELSAASTCPPPITVPGSRYSQVYKGCRLGTNVYYSKTECVKDNLTGLTWQGQTPAGVGLRANDQIKTNYDSTAGTQNYNGGNPIHATQAQIDAPTNAIGFKNAVNLTNLCGSSAWRLPTHTELLGLVKSTESPTIDNAWFPNTGSMYYWTSTPDQNYSYFAWAVSFDKVFATNNTVSVNLGRSNTINQLVRLVHN